MSECELCLNSFVGDHCESFVRAVYCFSEVLGAVLLDDVSQGDVVCVHVREVATNAESCLLNVVASSDQTVPIPVLA